MAWTSPKTANVGDVYTSAWYNTHTRDNLSYLKAAPTIDGDVTLASSLIISTLTPAGITADQNDYGPANFTVRTLILISTDAARNITGMVSNSITGLVKILRNVGANNAVLKQDNAGSIAANRYDLKGAVDLTLTPGMGAIFVWNPTRWQLVAFT
jgi:hypothetical protein